MLFLEASGVRAWDVGRSDIPNGIEYSDWIRMYTTRYDHEYDCVEQSLA